MESVITVCVENIEIGKSSFETQGGFYIALHAHVVGGIQQYVFSICVFLCHMQVRHAAHKSFEEKHVL